MRVEADAQERGAIFHTLGEKREKSFHGSPFLDHLGRVHVGTCQARIAYLKLPTAKAGGFLE
jgi:hypothetical protein